MSIRRWSTGTLYAVDVTSAPTSPELGLILDHRYRVDAMIARGGMATVFRGFDERLERPVALKIMHPHLAEDPDFIRRFAREARSAARLTHPHVVAVYDQGEDQGYVYLAMQLVEGHTLRSELRRDGAMTLRRALSMGRDTLAAIDAAHRSGIIHRDIKPENVLVSSSGTVLMADFGLARAIGSQTTNASGSLLGTVAYVSPEVVTRGFSDARSDLYSWGIMLFEMLTGRVPFIGESPVHVAYQHAHEDIPAPSSLNPQVPPAIDAIVTWASARLPSSRPPRAAELLDALDEAITTLSAEQLDAAPQQSAEADHPTQGVPKLTRTMPPAPTALTALAEQVGPAPATAFPIMSAGLDTDQTDPEQPDSDQADPGQTGTDLDTGGQDDDDQTDAVLRVSLPARMRRTGRHISGKRRSIPAAATAIAAVILALTAWGVAGGQWYLSEGPGGDRVVPVLAGAPLADAEAVLAAQNLSTRTVEEFNPEVPKGHVISADPAAGSAVKRGATVTITVSKGEELFAVPDVRGTTVDEATTALQKSGFRVVTGEPAFDEKVAEGAVVRQEQDAAELPKGATVTLIPSKGREPIQVPVVTGRSPADAEAALKQANLTVTTTEAFSNAPKGTVASQSPVSGTLHRGDTVTLVVSKGPEMVAVPDVFKKSEADAKAELEKAGLKAEVVHDKGAPVFNQVYAQDTAAGTSVPKGSTVRIRVF